MSRSEKRMPQYSIETQPLTTIEQEVNLLNSEEINFMLSDVEINKDTEEEGNEEDNEKEDMEEEANEEDKEEHEEHYALSKKNDVPEELSEIGAVVEEEQDIDEENEEDDGEDESASKVT